MSRIGVGIIGASPLAPGWAVRAHVPALKALPDYVLRAVSTSRRESAAVAVEAFGVEAAFDNPRDLINHPGVDLVVVAVKVPEHHLPVRAALEAGKNILCEWPLGNGLAEATDLAARADAAGVRTAIGLQARFAPAIRFARDLVKDGYVGEVLASSLVGSGMGWGPTTDGGHAYMFDAANGATTLTVSTLHALDALTFVLGDIATVAGTLAVRRREVRITDRDRVLPVTSPDHLALSLSMHSGAVVSVFYRGAASRAGNLRWEINGSRGDLLLTAANGNIQVADLMVAGGQKSAAGVEELPIPAQYSASAAALPQGPARNIGYLYEQLACDLREGTRVTPDFAAALRLHRLIEAIETASRTGVAQRHG